MSLLMDALRRAEEEKKQQARSEADSAVEETATELGSQTSELDAPTVEAPVAGPEDVTMQIEPAELRAAEEGSITATMEAEDLGLDLADGDLSQTFSRRPDGDDSSAFDLADDGTGTGTGSGLDSGDTSRSMSLPDGLSLEPMDDPLGDGDEIADDELAASELDETRSDGLAITVGGSTTTGGQRKGTDQTSTLPSTRAVANDLNDYFDRSQSMEAPRDRLQSDQTLEDVAAHTVVGAQTVFEASRRPRSNRLLIGIGVLAVTVVLGIGIVALFYAQQRPEPRPIPPPTVAAGVERPPVRELPVVPLESPPVAPEEALPRLDIEKTPQVVAAAGGDIEADALDSVDAPLTDVADATPAAPSSPSADVAGDAIITPEDGSAASTTAGAGLETASAPAVPATAATDGLATQPAAATPAAGPDDGAGAAQASAAAISAATSAAPAGAAPLEPLVMSPPAATPTRASDAVEVGLAAGEVRIARSVKPAAVDAQVSQAYAAYEAGNLDAAEGFYSAALAENPDQRDARLGLAAVRLAQGDYARAYEHYLAVLESHPGDAVASAAMLDLTGGQDERGAARLRVAIDQHRDNPYLHFALGNWYARQGRWADAQGAYFNAFALDSSDADTAYNLAVSLERMRQPDAARTYYQRALELAEQAPVRFETADALSRIQALSAPAGE